MPTYQYACTDCGDKSEVVQRFTDDPLTVCSLCGGKLRKVFSPVGIVFKGSGLLPDRQPQRVEHRPGGLVERRPARPARRSSSASSSGSSGSSEDSGSSSSSSDSKSSDSGSARQLGQEVRPGHQGSCLQLSQPG